MNISDSWLLLKKIAVGIVITIVPLIIIAGGLWSIQRLRPHNRESKPTSTARVAYAN
jgi:hypothetical protein